MTIDVRPFAPGDFDALCGWFPTEAALIQWGGGDMRFPLDHGQLDALLREGAGDRPQRRSFSGVAGDRLVAHCQVVLDWRHGVARLAKVAVHPDLRGRGLAIPFLSGIVERVFEDETFFRVELNVFTFNAAALATYRKLGFTQEGVRRAAVRVADERWDVAICGLLRSDRRAPAE